MLRFLKQWNWVEMLRFLNHLCLFAAFLNGNAPFFERFWGHFKTWAKPLFGWACSVLSTQKPFRVPPPHFGL